MLWCSKTPFVSPLVCCAVLGGCLLFLCFWHRLHTNCGMANVSIQVLCVLVLSVVLELSLPLPYWLLVPCHLHRLTRAHICKLVVPQSWLSLSTASRDLLPSLRQSSLIVNFLCCWSKGCMMLNLIDISFVTSGPSSVCCGTYSSCFVWMWALFQNVLLSPSNRHCVT